MTGGFGPHFWSVAIPLLVLIGLSGLMGALSRRGWTILQAVLRHPSGTTIIPDRPVRRDDRTLRHA